MREREEAKQQEGRWGKFCRQFKELAKPFIDVLSKDSRLTTLVRDAFVEFYQYFKKPEFDVLFIKYWLIMLT